MKERIRPTMNVTVNEDVLKEVDRLSRKLGMNRSQLVNNILTVGLEDVKMIEKVGLLDIANMMRNFQSKLSVRLQEA